jgi:hypothetical protein
VDGACSTHGRDGRCKQNCSLKACSLGRWEDNVKFDRKEMDVGV